MIKLDDWPTEAFDYVAKLRRESAQYREQRNSARKQLSEVRAELEALRK